jgi:hypothetical protein
VIDEPAVHLRIDELPLARHLDATMIASGAAGAVRGGRIVRNACTPVRRV